MAATMRVAAGLPVQGLYGRVMARGGVERGFLERLCVPSGRSNPPCSSIYIFLVTDTRGLFRVSRESKTPQCGVLA